MSSGDPVPAIAEADATGEIATLYADIRATLGVPLVNLIWRNLAAIPGGLAWAWLSVKPLYESGRIQREAMALHEVQAQRLPDISMMPPAALTVAGVDPEAMPTVHAILESYDRSNPLNLIALSALLARLRNETAPASAAIPLPATEPEAPLDATLPPLVALSEMSGATAELVQAVNRLGARGRDHILVSMPRHLAYWPGYLALYWALIAPLDATGDLTRAVDAVLADGQARGAQLAPLLGAAPEAPEGSRDAIEAALDDFCQNAISRMIPVVSLLRMATPPAS